MPPTFLSLPATKPEPNFLGATATFSATADGTGPLTYQWTRNGINLSDGGNVSGSATANLTLSNISLSNAASYTVIVTGFGAVTSAPPATLSVVTNYAPAIIASPQNLITNAGASAVFIVQATLK